MLKITVFFVFSVNFTGGCISDIHTCVRSVSYAQLSMCDLNANDQTLISSVFIQ